MKKEKTALENLEYKIHGYESIIEAVIATLEENDLEGFAGGIEDTYKIFKNI